MNKIEIVDLHIEDINKSYLDSLYAALAHVHSVEAEAALLAGRLIPQTICGGLSPGQRLTLKGNVYDLTGGISITSDTASSNYTTGALTVAGGVGIGKNLYVNGDVTSSFGTASLRIFGITGLGSGQTARFQFGGDEWNSIGCTYNGLAQLKGYNGTEIIVGSQVVAQFGSRSGSSVNEVMFRGTIESTSYNTGSFRTDGGVGIAKNLFVGQAIGLTQMSVPTVTADKLYNIGGDIYWNTVKLNAPTHDSLTSIGIAASGVPYGHINTDAQTLYGIKTFNSFPITPSAAPTTDYQVANKKYVDTEITTRGTDSKMDTGVPYDERQKFKIAVTYAAPNINVSLEFVGANTSFSYYINNVKYTVTSLTPFTNKTATAAEGVWFVYVSAAGIFTLTQDPWHIYIPDVLLWNFYFNASNNTITWIGEERHTYGRDIFNHARNHAQGAVYNRGFLASQYNGLSAFSTNNDNNTGRAQILISDGSFFDEDIKINIAHTDASISSTTAIPATDWNLTTNQFLGFTALATTGTTPTSIVFPSTHTLITGQSVTVMQGNTTTVRGTTTISSGGTGTTFAVSSVTGLASGDAIVIGARIPIYHISGVVGSTYTWRKLAATEFLGIASNVAFTGTNIASGVAQYVTNAGVFSNVTSGRYYPIFLVATNVTSEPIIAIIGQAQSTSATLSTALNEAAFQFQNLVGLSGLNIQEMVPFARLVFEYNSGNPFNASRIRLRAYSVIDIRVSTATGTIILPPVSTLPAGQITNDETNFNRILSASDTTVQTALDTIDNVAVNMNGVAGGQTIYGGTAENERLVLQGTEAEATSGGVDVSSSLDSSSTTTGSLTVAGGLGIAKKIYAGDYISLAQISAPNPTTDKLYNVGGSIYWNGTALGSADLSTCVLLAGRSGGQTLYGGVATGEALFLRGNQEDDEGIKITGGGLLQTGNIIGGETAGADLWLWSNSHATKGKIRLGSGSAYDEANVRLGIGTSSPGYGLEVVADPTITNGNLTANFKNSGDTSTMRSVTINLSHSNSTGAAIRMARDASATDGASLSFYTQPVGGAITERMMIRSNGSVSILTSTASTSTTTGALTVAGGVGIAGSVFAVGGNIAGTGTNSTRIGVGTTTALGVSSVAIGTNAVVGTSGIHYGVGIGTSLTVAGENDVCIGRVVTTSAISNSVAIGCTVNSTGGYSVAIGGWNTTASGASSVALGSYTKATARNATAIGPGANATATESTALGINSYCAHVASTALGVDSTSTAAYQMMLGSQNTTISVRRASDNSVQTGVANTTIKFFDANNDTWEISFVKGICTYAAIS